MKQIVTKNYLVLPENSAQAVGSGDLFVLSTPSLVAFSENACKEMIAAELASEETTVGIEIQLQHVQATEIGKTVTVQATLEKREKNRFYFSIKAFDSDVLIAEGKHVRVCVNQERFLSNL